MISGNDFRILALALPHVLEKPHFQRSSFRVDVPKGKIFTTMPGDEASANLMLTRDQQDMLCAAEPGIFSPLPNKWGEKGATLIDFAACELLTAKSVLKLAWKNAAPEKYWPQLDDVWT